MFGYIKAYPQELRLRENEYYRAAYCGLCRAMGKCCGCCSRAALSYDMVFALLVRMAISGTEPEFETGRCALHPFKKRVFMKLNPELRFTAYASSLLSYEKLTDDIRDEKGVKKATARVARVFLSGASKRARAELPELSERLSVGLYELSALEAKKEPSVDIPADLFGNIMAEIISYGYEGPNKKIASEIGAHAGRWVYIVDALDDCEQDLKKGRYNPFLMLYGAPPSGAQKELLPDILNAELISIGNAMDLIDRGGRRDLFEILENIVGYGMRESADRAIKGKDIEKK